MVSPCWVSRTSGTGAVRVSDQTCGLVFGQVPGRERGDRNSTSASEETQNRRNTMACEPDPEPVAEETPKVPDLEEG